MQAILHCDKKWGIGRGNDLMFKLPKDMKYFKEKTIGKVVVMGSNTLLSFPNGKPLKNRTNIVLWPNGDSKRAIKDGFILVESLEDLFDTLSVYASDDIFVIGGAMMYHTLLPYCNKVFLTKVDADGNAQVFFDNLDELANWSMTRESEKIDDNGYQIQFTTYENNATLPFPCSFKKALEEIKSFDRIIIHRHKRPDGDAYGSQLGLYLIIKENYPQKEVYMVGDSNDRLSFILGNYKMDDIDSNLYSTALAVILDTSSEELISDDRYKMAKRTLRFDHHIYQGKIANSEVIDSSYESCSGIIANFAHTCNLYISNSAAQALFTGIVTDSGRFRYDSTSSKTFETVAFLMKHKIDTSSIYTNLYTTGLSSVKLKAKFALKIKTTEHNVAYIYSTKEELSELGIDALTATRAYVNTMADIKGIDVWVSFAEGDSGISCELRSSIYNINPIAIKYGGGGHAKASGATVNSQLVAMEMLKDLDNLVSTQIKYKD